MDLVFRRSYTGPLKAAIFDWAGTTVDYGCFAPAVVFQEVYKKHGVDISMAQAREPMGAAKRLHIKMISQMEPVAAAWQAANGSPCSEADIDVMYQEFIPMQLKCILDYNDLIPGTNECMHLLRNRGMKIGATTGYNGAMMKAVADDAKLRGYEPDLSVCADDVPAGRPSPWMAIKAAMDLEVYPFEAIVKVGDTVPDIDEGVNGGMWSVGVVTSGNEIGMTPQEIRMADPCAFKAKHAKASLKLAQAGAHYVIDSIADLMPVIDDINLRLARGEKP